ncbi:MAG: 6-pyruvoyl tetrahydropterin synthase family protein [Promethearchaeota archaeon]
MSKHIAVEVSGIDFAAAHFVSEGGTCEQLHGHNYHVTVTVYGELNEYGMVIDFRILKQRIRDFCKQWDHFILLPATSQLITTSQQDQQTQVTTPTGTYSFPSKDVRVIEVVETTAEELARFLCQQLKENLSADFPNISKIQVSLAESASSRAIVSMSV